MTAPELVLTPSEMKQADLEAMARGIPGIELMRRAGRAVADSAEKLASPGSRIAVVSGPGQNGGDGFVAATILAGRGYRVSLGLLGSLDRLTGDAAEAARDWTGAVVPIEELPLQEADLIVDALFGTGLSRDLDGATRHAVDRMNGSGRPILAVDLPSGIDGGTGAVRGIAVKAVRTVTFAARKPCHLLMPGRAHAGLVEVADIGIGRDILAAKGGSLFGNDPALWLASLPRPGLSSHKYERGHTLVASGGATRTGAARLAARAALRIGSGLVTVASPPEALGVNAAHLTAIMLKGCDGPEGLHAILQDARFNAVVLGPALGVHAGTRAMVAVAVQARRNLVLDADALTSFEGLASELHGAFRHAPTVLTPHDGEFARLFKGHPDILDPESKIERARRAAAYSGAVVLLKGADTVIAAPDGRAAINANGTPYLATAGSGDTLCGLIAGLMAQDVPAFEAACAGAWIHGEAGASFGPGLISEDLAELVPGVLRGLLR
ncbi:bifunctional ADP-dependent NAD(P)H-hydrate dehydratase/NAD(P)H-hydrate epimerase [Microvirga lotononidis]|uniref:Bifunctional NAD(P)H-hydrate repair enzyme n=1 Tax=Microvirga lotononidis TaxID=864069 RepID=I4YZV5_9HYPH|nr:bifunctional ADP-dependent NAD(P)H-hydrate dehydratase/NAD(P)H-hydrate epimerase [Microvirga lotononidis]EIM29497.1 yjeF-like protein [Microvirga lotononidis]WQO27188.1 bifunctional ADP-dependent NAD(P)H-hydrate dehydratase/NAD(P)H-hydrate epimerase [Microvirga lotononidis]